MRSARGPWVVAIGAIGMLAVGCGGKGAAVKPLEPVLVRISIEAGHELNPDAAGRASPVFVRIYALREDSGLMNADFGVLAGDDSGSLSGSITQSQSLTIRPGEQREVAWELDPASKALAAVAEFRDPNDSIWRTSLSIPGESGGKHAIMHVRLLLEHSRVRFERVE